MAAPIPVNSHFWLFPFKSQSFFLLTKYRRRRRPPDRDLTLVPKKGRPVTQCQHCRLERKKRSAHVKCDCGEADKPHHPKEKCIHLREAEERAKAGFHDDHSDDNLGPAVLAAVAEEQDCCCHHGGPCSCAGVKRDSDKGSGSSTPTYHGPAVHKPRLETTRSDGSITVFTNGHHKPVHRKNHAAHECGMPYKMPMPRSYNDQTVMSAARRSVDSLALDHNTQDIKHNNTNTKRNVPQFDPTPFQMSKSEEHSPRPLANGADSNWSEDRSSALDYTSLGPVQTNQNIKSIDSLAFSPLDPMPCVADAPYDPWSTLPSGDSNNMPNNNPFGVWPTTYDNSSVAQPALTAASSGTQSEIDEIPPTDEMYGFPMPSIQEVPSGFNFDSLMGNDLSANRRSLPPNFFGNADFSLPRMDNEWQMIASLSGSEGSKSKPMGSESNSDFGDGWPTSPMTGVAQRSSAGLSAHSGRPHSLSAGPSSAPNDDIIKQLFPGIDIDGGIFVASANSPLMTETSTTKRQNSSVNPISAPMEFSGLEDSVAGFVSQSWSDGSISVPNDSFSSPYNLDQEFSNPDFTASWPDQ